MTSVIFLSTILLSTMGIIQGTWLRNLTILGAAPDFPMLILMWLSFNNARGEGPVSGFLAGLVEDIISSAPFGAHAFNRTLVAYIASLFHGSFHLDNIIMPALFGIGGTLLKALSSFLLSLLFGAAIFTYSLVEFSFWIQCGMNGILAPLVFFLLSKTRRYLVTDDKKR